MHADLNKSQTLMANKGCAPSVPISAVSLISGGLDGILATRLVMDMDIEVTALFFTTPFFGSRHDEGRRFILKMMKDFGICTHVIDISDKYMRMLKSPAHGYGGYFNPCIDCKILMISEALKYMEDAGAKFIVTGEVLGQRPMSQRRDSMRIIERDSGAEGILLRPLCAKLLKPTIPETEGWVDRKSLFDFSGRSRKPQINLAENLGITDYQSPGGGCCLTDPIISKRIKKLYEIKDLPDPHDVELLRVGRPFHIGDGVIMTLGRDFAENEVIEKIGVSDATYIKLFDLLGPTGIVRGTLNDKKIAIAMSILARYSKAKDEDKVRVGAGKSPHSFDTVISVRPSDDDKIRDLRL